MKETSGRGSGNILSSVAFSVIENISLNHIADDILKRDLL